VRFQALPLPDRDNRRPSVGCGSQALTLESTTDKLSGFIGEPQRALVKTYRSPRNVVAEIERLVAADKPSPHPPSALARIAKLLCDSRRYQRAGIYLLIDGREVPRALSGSQTASPPGTDLSVPIKIASETLGSLRVQLAPGHTSSFEERVLLHAVAEILALYLSGKGKYLVRKAREALRESVASGEARGYQPASDKGNLAEARLAAAGDKSRS